MVAVATVAVAMVAVATVAVAMMVRRRVFNLISPPDDSLASEAVLIGQALFAEPVGFVVVYGPNSANATRLTW